MTLGEERVDGNEFLWALMRNSAVRRTLPSLEGIPVSKKFCLLSGIGGVFDRVLITYPNDKPLLSSRINNVSRW